MNKSKTYSSYFLKGSSLIESVIAITIIAVCLLIGIRMYAAVLNSSESVNSYRIKFKVAQLYNETKRARNFEDEVYDYKTFSVKKKVVDFEGNKSIKNVRYIVETVSDTIIYNYLLKNKDE